MFIYELEVGVNSCGSVYVSPAKPSLFSLELFEAVKDPEVEKVAEELIYHVHPAVAWRAFQVIFKRDRKAALHYIPIMRQLKNHRVDRLFYQYGDDT